MTLKHVLFSAVFARFRYAVFLFGLAPIGTYAQDLLTNDMVLSLVKAGIAENAVIELVNSQRGTYVVSAAELIRLKEAGASDTIILALVKNRNNHDTSSEHSLQAPYPLSSVNEAGIVLRRGTPLALRLLHPKRPLIDDELLFQTAGDLAVSEIILAPNGAILAGRLLTPLTPAIPSDAVLKLVSGVAVPITIELDEVSRKGRASKIPFHVFQFGHENNQDVAGGVHIDAYVKADTKIPSDR